MTTQRTTFTIHIEFAEANKINKLADVQLVFKGGPLDGVKLGGFSVWQNKGGDGENVSFPSRPFQGKLLKGISVRLRREGF